MIKKIESVYHDWNYYYNNIKKRLENIVGFEF
jgi:hypothetical protein